LSSQGGVIIKVTANRQTEDDIELQVSVEDTGISIPADKLDKLFCEVMLNIFVLKNIK
jgi:signal transduction histidine kinase